MAKKSSTPPFSPAELATLDALISHLQQSGIGPDEPHPLTTAVIAVVEVAAAATAAVLCVRAPEDDSKIAQIKTLAEQLKTSTTLSNLIELRRRAVISTAKSITKN